VANRLTSVDGQAHTWDNNGNPSASSGQALLSDGEKTYTYDQTNRLIRVTTPDIPWSVTHAREALPDLSGLYFEGQPGRVTSISSALLKRLK
jgi:hypothetical protein